MAITQGIHFYTHHRRDVKSHHDEQITKDKYYTQISVDCNTKDVKFHILIDVCYLLKSYYILNPHIIKPHQYPNKPEKIAMDQQECTVDVENSTVFRPQHCITKHVLGSQLIQSAQRFWAHEAS
jgi:hypothetical protein